MEEESNDPASNAIRAEEPAKESVDSKETSVGKVQEPSIDQTGSASVEALTEWMTDPDKPSSWEAQTLVAEEPIKSVAFPKDLRPVQVSY